MASRWLVMEAAWDGDTVYPDVLRECLSMSAAVAHAMERCDGRAMLGQECVYVVVEVPAWCVVHEVRSRRIGDCPSRN